MGNNNTTATSNQRNFDNSFQIQKYVGRGLQQQQIIKIKEAFDSFEPVDGYIDVQKIKELSKGSHDKKTIDQAIGNRTRFSFDDFFVFSQQLISEKLRNDPNVVIDASEIQATCLFCPYAVDKAAKTTH